MDPSGNRTKTLDNTLSIVYTANGFDQYTQVGNYAVTNGADHDVSDYQGVSYSYYNDERLKTVTSSRNSYSLAYDALGRCVKRTLNGRPPIAFTTAKSRSWSTTTLARGAVSRICSI